MRFASVADDVGFTEGPVCTSDGALAFVSVDRGVVYRVDADGCRVLAAPGGGPNGLAEGTDGTLYLAQNGGRWSAQPRPAFAGGVQAVTRTGDLRWVTQDPIAPNDLCLGPDGALYVTDPTRRPAMDDGRLWRVEPETGDAHLLASVGWYPNGIAFGPDGALYVARTGERQILRRDGGFEVFCETGAGLPDGIAWDADGNLVVAAVGVDEPGALRVHDRAGALLDTIAPGSSRHYTNLAISPAAELYVTDADAGCVLVTQWQAAGLATGRTSLTGTAS